ncbi:hypothetical protein ACTU3N_13960 [Vagococcus sp. WN89Y]
MRKAKKVLIYVLTVIIFFLIIPEIILRVLSPEQLGRLSDFTSLGGLIHPLLSLLIFLGLFSIVLAIVTVSVVGKILRMRARSESQ